MSTSMTDDQYSRLGEVIHYRTPARPKDTPRTGMQPRVAECRTAFTMSFDADDTRTLAFLDPDDGTLMRWGCAHGPETDKWHMPGQECQDARAKEGA